MTTTSDNLYTGTNNTQITNNGSTDQTINVQLIKNRLRNIWAQILQKDTSSFSDQDSFFEVGGTRSLAADLSLAVRKQGFLLTVEEIFTHASLEDMAKTAQVLVIREDNVTNDESKLEPFSLLSTNIPREDQIEMISLKCHVARERIENAYPCSPMQESLVAMSDGTNNLSIRQLVYKLHGADPPDKLYRAWRYTARANPVLRTRICRLEGGIGYLQAVIDEDILWSSVHMDLTQYLQEDARVYMQEGDPFFRYAIVTEDEKERGTRQYFVWTVHHALCDGASILEIHDDLSRLFHDAPNLHRAPFELFIKSLKIIADPSSEQQFWQQFLSGIHPTSYPPVQVDPNFRANPSSTLSQEITFDRRPPPGLSRALFLRAAWAILLTHHTGTEDIVFGTINNGRKSAVPGIFQMTGPTINLTPVALHVDPKELLSSFILRVRAQAAEMKTFEHSGISRIRKFLAGGGSTATEFQTLFVVHPVNFGHAAAPSLRKLELDYLPHLGKTEQHSYPLVVSFTLSAGTVVTLEIQYDQLVLSTKQVHNLMNQFQAVLTGMSNASEDTLLESISPLSDQDMTQIYEWNKTTPPAEQICIHNLFQQQVNKHPNAEAVCSLEQTLSYAEVDISSTKLALRLVELGVHPNTFVAVCFEKSIWTVVAILAVFKAGAVYVPIDPTHPRGRITELVEMAQIKVTIASTSSARVLAGLCDKILGVHESPLSPATLLPECLPSSTAYLLFTSGSTGKPKGILMSHSAMCTSILHHGAAFGAGPNWRTLQFASHTFDISLSEFLTTLCFGGCICIPSDHERLNSLAATITLLKINTALIVPTVANLLSPEEVPTLKAIVLGGEPVHKDTIMKWADHVSLTNGYGPSETAVYCAGNVNISADAHPANIGRSIGANMWIVDGENYHQLCAIGCIGEIVISGAILGNGYFGDKASTDAAFVPAPDWLKIFHPESPYKTLYRTGDFARYNQDGTFHIVGRRDTQVKLRGFRIELGEIESQIIEHSPITAALAILPTQGLCERQIVAVVSFNRSDLKNHGGSEITFVKEKNTDGILEKLKSHLSLTLPEYMIPSIWVVLEEMPRLFSGKINRKAVIFWVQNMTESTYKVLVDEPDPSDDAEFVSGTTANTLRQIWSEVLGVPTKQIGMKTSFFSLGGDSISAIQIISKAKAAGLPVTVRGLIISRTLGNLSSFVERSLQTAPQSLRQLPSPQSTTNILLGYEQSLKSRLGANPSIKIEDAYRLSPLQREIMKQRAVNPAVFVFSWQMEISSRTFQSISLPRLVQAWKHVVQKYPILRSIFLQDPAGNKPPVQVVLRKESAEPVVGTTLHETLPHVDDCFLPHRARFFHHGDKIAGRIDLDHLVLDGWSLRLVKEALLAAYDDTDKSREEPPSYKSFISTLRPDRVDGDKKYWASVFRNQPLSLLSFPVISPSNSKSSPSSKNTILPLPHLEARSLNRFSAQHGITTASIFDAAWAQTLSILTQSPDVSFEYVVSGRDQELSNIFDIVGPVFNVLAYHLRSISTENSSIELAHLAQRIQEQRMHDAQYISCNIREVLENDLAVRKPFNTGLNFQRRPKAVWTDNIRIDEDLKQSVDPWHFDVLIRILHIVDDDSLQPFIEFDARVFDQDEMKKVTRLFWDRVQTAISET